MRPLYRKLIKSIQYASATIASGATTAMATITSVDTGKATIELNGTNASATGTSNAQLLTRCAITSTTEVTFTRNTSTTSTITCECMVIEWGDDCVVQTGTITTASGSLTGTATISAVDLTRTIIFYQGRSQNGGGGPSNGMMGIYLSSSTQVTAIRTGTGAVMTMPFSLVQLPTWAVRSLQNVASLSTDTTGSYTATVTAFDPRFTVPIFNGTTYTNATTSYLNNLYTHELTNTTTVTFLRGGTDASTRVNYLSLLELRPEAVVGVVQSSDITLASTVTSGTDDITGTLKARTLSMQMGMSTTVNTANPAVSFSRATLTDNETVTVSRTTGTNTTRSIVYSTQLF